MISKHCTGCGQVKPNSEFGKHAIGLHGTRSKCRLCTSKKNADWYASNTEKKLARNRAWLEQNKARHSELVSTWYIANKSKYKESRATFRAANLDKYKEQVTRYRKKNLAALALKNVLRRGVCRMATPSWADMNQMNAIYAEADRISQATNEQHHVDHLVPLVSPRVQSLDMGNPIRPFVFIGPLMPIVQGFHCQSNLGVKHYRENIKKSNRYWPDMPDLKL